MELLPPASEEDQNLGQPNDSGMGSLAWRKMKTVYMRTLPPMMKSSVLRVLRREERLL
tara:strand:+ start:912 stop:1085 length:174 start_codon:yes stop_codon:yes gene_type:complete